MNNNDFCSALVKLSEPTAKNIHLTPQQARAVLEYLAAHGLRVDVILAYWQRNGQQTAVKEPTP